MLRFDFNTIPATDARNLPYDFLIVLSVRIISFAVSKTYKGVVRYTGSRDTIRIFSVVVMGSLFIFVLNQIAYFSPVHYFIPNSVIIIDGLVTLFLMISSRLAVKALYFEFTMLCGSENLRQVSTLCVAVFLQLPSATLSILEWR